MICNVFVCNVWKAAGLFADIGNQVDLIPPIGSLLWLMHFPQINCGETSVNDNYRLAHYRLLFRTKNFHAVLYLLGRTQYQD